MIVATTLPITDAIYTGGNLLEDDYDEWAESTMYTRSTFVLVAATHSIFQCLKDHDSTAENSPTVEALTFSDPLIPDPDDPNWQYFSASNKWRLFDGRPTRRAANPNRIEVELTIPAATSDTLAFVELVDCNSIEVELTDAGNQVFRETFSLLDDREVVDWKSYFYSPVAVANQYLVDIPLTAASEVLSITLAGGADLACGQIVLGYGVEIGEGVVGQSGIQVLDFSHVETDRYGNLTTVEREAVDVFTFDVLSEVAKGSLLANVIRKQKGGKRALWISDPGPQLRGWLYGFLSDSRSNYQEGTHITSRIIVQGVT